MRKFSRPQLVVSKCLEFDSCRYDASIIKSSIIQGLKNHADFKPVCPEVEVGLGIPRAPMRLVENGKMIELIQPSTGVNVTEKMSKFADSFLDSLPLLDGFILKNKSPSCGIKAVRIYPTEVTPDLAPMGWAHLPGKYSSGFTSYQWRMREDSATP